MFELLAVILVLSVIVGTFCGFIALVRLSGLEAQMRVLQQRIQQLQAESKHLHTRSEGAAVNANASQVDASLPSSAAPANPLTDTVIAAQMVEPNTATTTVSPAAFVAISKQHAEPTEPVKPKAEASQWLSWLERQFIDRGMVWLGGVALAFGGIFLVRHSLDAGWFSPELRVFSGISLGLLLLVVSEWLHQKKQLSQVLENYIPAALASAGFVTLYAVLLMAQHFYQLISPTLAFALLALVALCASWFSLRQGPILAVIGIVGGYAVPILVSPGGNNWLALLLYIALITTSSLLVERRVQRFWLWLITVVAHCGWLLLAITQAGANNITVLWAALLFSFIGMVALPRLGWPLRWQKAVLPMRQWWPLLREHYLGVVLLAFAVVLQLQFSSYSHLWSCVLLVSVLYAAALSENRSELWLWAAALLALVWLLLGPALNADNFSWTDGILFNWQSWVLLLTIPAAFVSVLLPARQHWAAFLAVAPILFLAVSYQLVPNTLQPLIQLGWMLYGALLVILQSILAKQSASKALAFIHAAGANLALSWCFSLYLSAAAFTVALALQLVFITQLSVKQRFPIPSWLIKGMVAFVLLRLTSAPLLGSYEGISILGLHWSLIVYPLVLASFGLATWLWRHSSLRGWLEGACLQLTALFVTVQTQLGLHPGALDFSVIDFYSLALHSANWSILAWVYQWRSYRAASMQTLYRFAAGCLVVLVLFTQLTLNVNYNPLLSAQDVGQWPLLNWLFILWAVPALCAAGLANMPLPQRYRPTGYYVAAAGLLLYLLSSVRQFWQGSQITLGLATSNAEHYSYSLVLLLTAAGLIVLAQWRVWGMLRKVGFLLLSAVVIKVFVFDLNELQGLFRAASFMGLGLSLVLLSAMFQRLQQKMLDRQAHATE